MGTSVVIFGTCDERLVLRAGGRGDGLAVMRLVELRPVGCNGNASELTFIGGPGLDEFAEETRLVLEVARAGLEATRLGLRTIGLGGSKVRLPVAGLGGSRLELAMAGSRGSGVGLTGP